MCGFVGYLDTANASGREDMERLVLAMGKMMDFRGPDDCGAWADPEAGFAVTHNRLSIIDLSPMGHQPMVSANGRYVIAYNGEVYNFAELRADLEKAGHSFRGHSDTEVILEACAVWGTEAAVKRFVGMFAFVIWDRHERTMTFARDRLGKKPLYWGTVGGVFFFGSQPGAFSVHPKWRGQIDKASLATYMRHAYVPGPHSIFQGISKLKPGYILEVDYDGTCRKTQYWDAKAAAAAGHADPLDCSDDDAIAMLERTLNEAVKLRMISDVPLGAFLSGGVDSSTIVALMQAQSRQPIRTFTIGFHEKGYNEAEHAKNIARVLGTEHTELYVSPKTAMDVLTNLSKWYDEPFADSSQIPTYLVSEMTRRHVTVALSGDGGDELFMGYNRYFWGESLWKWFGFWPHAMRAGVGDVLQAVSPLSWDRMFGVLPDRIRPPQPGDKIHKIAKLLSQDTQADIYRCLVSQWDEPGDVVLDATEHKGILWHGEGMDSIKGFAERMQLLDILTYLPDDILAKVDRASMAVSLESRVPLLDHRVVELAFKMPKHMKVRDGQSKWLLRQILYKHVPQDLIERPKMGFAVPIDRWLREDLRDWGEGLLDSQRLREDGFFNAQEVRRVWDDHQSGRTNRQYTLWPILMFQDWKTRWMS